MRLRFTFPRARVNGGHGIARGAAPGPDQEGGGMKDLRVIGREANGHLIFQVGTEPPYTSGETLAEWGEDNLRPAERVTLGLPPTPTVGPVSCFPSHPNEVTS